MDHQVFLAQKAYAGEKIPSMTRRCEGFDYTQRRMYMITMVTEGRRQLFGQIVGDSEAPRGTDCFPHILLSPLGEAVAQNWRDIPMYHPEVSVLSLQMMPDHLHGILFVERKLPIPLGKVLLGFKQGCNKAYRQLHPQSSPATQVGVLLYHSSPPANRVFSSNRISTTRYYGARTSYRHGRTIWKTIPAGCSSSASTLIISAYTTASRQEATPLMP